MVRGGFKKGKLKKTWSLSNKKGYGRLESQQRASLRHKCLERSFIKSCLTNVFMENRFYIDDN